MPPRKRHSLSGRRETVRLFTRVVIAIPLVAAAGVMLWLGVFARPAPARLLERFHVKPGGRVPYVQLQDRAGQATSLSDAVRGPALVVITDAECEYCDSELKTLRGMGNGGAAVVAVSVSRAGGFQTLAARHPGLPLYDDVNGAFRGKLGLKGVPVTMAVAADGTVRDIKFGLQNGSQLEALMKAAAAPGRLSAAGAPAGR